MVENLVIAVFILFAIVQFTMYIMICIQMNKFEATCERVHDKWIAQRIKRRKEEGLIENLKSVRAVPGDATLR